MSSSVAPPTPQEPFVFGNFRCDPQEGVLYRGNKAVPLPPKAAQTLVVLLRSAPRLVEKDELLKAVWPDTFVEENNLTQNISLLRKTLGTNGGGQGYIETIPRRGYRFVGALKTNGVEEPATEAASPDRGSVLNLRNLFRVAATLALFLLALSLWHQRTSSAVEPPPARGGTRNPAAYREFLNGRLLYTKHDPESLQKAVEAFEHAVQLDPGYAAAYSSLAESYMLLGQHQSSTTALERMNAAASTALQLDPDLPQANAIFGFGKALNGWEWTTGEKHIRRALELDPKYIQAHIFLSIMLSREGRTAEALEEANQALAEEPFHEVLPWLFANIYYQDRQYDAAMEWIEKAGNTGTRFGSLPQLAGIIRALRGECAVAMQSIKKVTPETREQMGPYGFVQGRCGHAAKALELERKLLAVPDVDRGTTAYFAAVIEMGVGREQDALRNLEVAYEGHSAYLTRIKGEPVFDPLRDEPRFRKLVQEIGLARFPSDK